MAIIWGALHKLGEADLPYISTLTNPTAGSVTAFFATITDPGNAKETSHQKILPGFQTSKSITERGLVYAIIPAIKCTKSSLEPFRFHDEIDTEISLTITSDR